MISCTPSRSNWAHTLARNAQSPSLRLSGSPSLRMLNDPSSTDPSRRLRVPVPLRVRVEPRVDELPLVGCEMIGHARLLANPKPVVQRVPSYAAGGEIPPNQRTGVRAQGYASVGILMPSDGNTTERRMTDNGRDREGGVGRPSRQRRLLVGGARRQRGCAGI